MAKSSVIDWLNTRVPIDWDNLRHLSSEPIPRHLKSWWFCLGGTPLYLFFIQVTTGIALTFYYVPQADRAYDSVRHISEVVPFGWYLRSIHVWAGHLMVVSVILHMMRVFFTGAYRKPRELNWVVGFGLLLVIMSFGFTGYSLQYSQISYWAAVVGTNISEAVPFVGSYIAGFIRGGPAVGPNTLTRFYIFHIGVLPTLAFLLIAAHVFLIRAHGVTEIRREGGAGGTGEKERFFPFFPDHILTEMIIAVFLMFLLSQLALIFPAALGEPADPAVTPEHIKPEWYFYPVFRWLKLFSFQVGLLSALLGVGVMVLWPWIDAGIDKKAPGLEISIYVGIAAVLLLTGLMLWEGLAS